MDAIFTNSRISKTSYPHGILLNLSDKINLKRRNKYTPLSNLSIYYTWKNIKISYKNNKVKTSAPRWNEGFIYLMDHILFQMFKIILNISLKI